MKQGHRKSTDICKRKCEENGAKRLITIAANKVADTRPRFKGRFVSVDQADEFNERLRKERQEKLKRERIFITQKFDKKTGALIKTVYPTIEVYELEAHHANHRSEVDSYQSLWNIEHDNELIVVLTDLPEYE